MPANTLRDFQLARLKLLNTGEISSSDDRKIELLRVLLPQIASLCEAEEKHWSVGRKTFPCIGFYYPSSNQSGFSSIVVFDELGEKLEGGLEHKDIQSDSAGVPVVSDSLATKAEETTPEQSVRDSKSTVQQKTDALYNWLLEDNETAAKFLLAELERRDLSKDWRNALVLATDEAYFQRQDDQIRICKMLKQLAFELRNASEPGVNRVVWAAVRRWASLLPEENANEFVEFLNNTGGVDTRIVALRGLVGMFFAAPPAHPEKLQPLADRVFQITNKLLDPDVLTAGETSAIARLGIHASAALADARLDDLIHNLKKLHWNWLTRKVHGSLVDLVQTWKGAQSGIGSQEASKRIEKNLTDLE